MADTKLTDLLPLLSAYSTDVIYIVSLQSVASGESMKIDIGDLFGKINVPVIANSGLYAATATINNLAVTNNITLSSAFVGGTLTVTGNTVLGNLSANTITLSGDSYLNNVSATGITVTGGLTASSDIISDLNVQPITSTKYFTYSADNSRIYNFDTTISDLTAIFDPSLPNGFTTGIINIGSGVVNISSTQTPFINATSTKNNAQYTGMFIYKTGGLLYGVGRFT